MKLAKELSVRHGVHMVIDRDRLIRYVVYDKLDNDSDAGGARIVMSVLEKDITTPVAAFINAHPDVKRIKISVVGDMAADNKMMRKSKASIRIAALVKR